MTLLLRPLVPAIALLATGAAFAVPASAAPAPSPAAAPANTASLFDAELARAEAFVGQVMAGGINVPVPKDVRMQF